MHFYNTCSDPTCAPCLDLSQREGVVRLDRPLFNVEAADHTGAYVDSTPTVDWLDVRNVLNLMRTV